MPAIPSQLHLIHSTILRAYDNSKGPEQYKYRLTSENMQLPDIIILLDKLSPQAAYYKLYNDYLFGNTLLDELISIFSITVSAHEHCLATHMRLASLGIHYAI